ncbi:hypothetical protein CYY_004869 [Polysphondylium violaceum]|uniref:Uncharacterized protein n=1 Tax=Polysphondylium violaceum TaxID=133409 RepID=A0A8J4Q4J7_9MYCE|nr:hypothetical protein CYY_004869 [Polysphondylium violaceum]
MNINNVAVNQSKFLLRAFDQIKDMKPISEISRLSTSTKLDAMEAISHPKDFTLRAGMTQRNKIIVAEDIESKRSVGSYGCNIKDMKVFGRKKTVFYAFDFTVNEEFRNKSLGKLFINHLNQSVNNEYLKNPDNEPLLFASTSKSNGSINKVLGGVEMKEFYDQRQCAWKLDEEMVLPSMHGSQFSVHVYQEKRLKQVKRQWEDNFKSFDMTPYDFNDILVHNNQYYETTYVAQLKKDDKVFGEASISLWNQDKIFSLKDKKGSSKQHRQLFSCYSNGFEKFFTFDYLLKYVHNDQMRKGVDYLFGGFAINDPIIKHFPLVNGIKNLDFTANVRLNNQQESKLLQKSRDESTPYFNDPRDYGVVAFHELGKTMV